VPADFGQRASSGQQRVKNMVKHTDTRTHKESSHTTSI